MKSIARCRFYLRAGAKLEKGKMLRTTGERIEPAKRRGKGRKEFAD
jgi:hypothetical protein